MEKEFVPFKIAKKLRALGFDESCCAFYEEERVVTKPEMVDDKDQYRVSGWRTCKNSEVPTHYFAAATFSQAFRWFRDKNFHVNIESYHSLGNHKPFGLSIDYLHESGKWTYIDHGGDFDFQTYEEAQERAIEIIIGILEK